MAEGSIIQGKIVQKQVIRCRLHDKEGRYELAFYPKDNLLIYRCLLCNKFENLMRCQLPKKGEN